MKIIDKIKKVFELSGETDFSFECDAVGLPGDIGLVTPTSIRLSGKTSDLHNMPIEILENIFDYIKFFAREGVTRKHGRTIVTFPQSQNIMDEDGFYIHSALITDKDGKDLFGDMAYVVDTNWYNSHRLFSIDEADCSPKIAILKTDKDGFEFYFIP